MNRRSESRLPDSDFRNQWINEAAFFHSENRNFAPGCELDDWLCAENIFEQAMFRRHTLHKFDSELEHLHSQVTYMADLEQNQLLRVLQALTERNAEVANLVIAGDQAIDACEVELDKQVLQILCLEHPVANDLRVVLSAAKIGYELESIGNKLVEVAQAAVVLFGTESRVFDSETFDGVVMLGKRLEALLGNLINALENRNLVDIGTFRQYFQDCQTIQRESIARLTQEIGMLPGVIELLRMMKSFEACDEHCLDIAKYLNHMNETLP
ncbi:MAG: PhoU domain-containing protein [Methylococcaceae bacterium]